MYCVFVKKDDSLKTKQIFCMKCVKNCMKENKDDFGEFCKQTSKQANKQYIQSTRVILIQTIL